MTPSHTTSNSEQEENAMSDTAIVRELAERIRKAQRRGPGFMRRAGTAHSGRDVGGGRNTFLPYMLYDEGSPWFLQDRHSWPRMRALFRRAMKKAGQPYRKKHQRGQLRAKAAGKNNVRRQGSVTP